MLGFSEASSSSASKGESVADTISVVSGYADIIAMRHPKDCLLYTSLHTGAYIPYFYSSYSEKKKSVVTDKKKIIVLGAGPIRIGQGVEFDYSTVHAVKTIKEDVYKRQTSTC